VLLNAVILISSVNIESKTVALGKPEFDRMQWCFWGKYLLKFLYCVGILEDIL